MKTKRHLSRLEIVKLSNLIETNIEKLDGGLVRYRDDWTDEKIARHIAGDLNADHAARLRTELFGSLISTDRKDIVSSSRITDLERQVSQLQQSLTGETAARLLLEKRHRHLWEQFDKLCDALALNRVLDARALKYKADPTVNDADARTNQG